MERGWKVRAGSQNARNILARMLHRDGNHTPKETGASRTTNGNGDHLSGLRGPRFASSMFLRFDLAPILFRTRGSADTRGWSQNATIPLLLLITASTFVLPRSVAPARISLFSLSIMISDDTIRRPCVFPSLLLLLFPQMSQHH